MRGKPLILRKLDNGCIVPISHKICKNRACCNIEHLQMLKGTEHTIKDNKLRYKARKDEAKNYWMQTKCTGSYLASLFCVSFSTACKWIREWKV